jgi:hypothetical protein
MKSGIRIIRILMARAEENLLRRSWDDLCRRMAEDHWHLRRRMTEVYGSFNTMGERFNAAELKVIERTIRSREKCSPEDEPEMVVATAQMRTLVEMALSSLVLATEITRLKDKLKVLGYHEPDPNGCLNTDDWFDG